MAITTLLCACTGLLLNLIIYVVVAGFSGAENAVDINPNNAFDSSQIKILQFPNEESFLEKFGEDEQVAQLYNNTTMKAKPNPKIPGDMGLPVVIENPSEEVQNLIDKGVETYGYNKYVSDLIPVKRRLRDFRPESCFSPNRLLEAIFPTSVIICFYNEALSVLLRSIHSILDRSPPHLLSEIILIDDFSDHEDLKDKLESEIKNFSNIRLIRLPKREGLIRARLIGSELASSPILTFLDSHIEVSQGWLEELLDRVTRNWKTISIPVMDTINHNTFSYDSSNGSVTSVGSFTWSLMFSWKAATEKELQNAKTPADPISSPTMPGGLFSIHSKFFEYLSKFDDQYEIWGAENMELSFKAWMCGGRIEIVPCSHVAHLERIVAPYDRSTFRRNAARLAAVWLDEYSEYYFKHTPEANRDYGDISSRLEVKRKLNCFSFDWYMKNILPDAFNPKNALALGQVKNQAHDGAFCLDSILNSNASKESPSLYWTCHGDGGNQFWYYTPNGEIRQQKKCLDFFGSEDGEVALLNCHAHKGNQMWEYHADTGVIFHPNSNRCLTLEQPSGKVVAAACQGESKQKWNFQHEIIFEFFRNYKFS